MEGMLGGDAIFSRRPDSRMDTLTRPMVYPIAQAQGRQ